MSVVKHSVIVGIGIGKGISKHVLRNTVREDSACIKKGWKKSLKSVMLLSLLLQKKKLRNIQLFS